MNKHVQLAKQAVETYVKEKIIIDAPKDLPTEFYFRQAGVFVTLRKDKKLRGCVGTYLPAEKNLVQEIISNAVAACSEDCRFSPVAEDELSALNYEVSVLSPSKPMDLSEHDPHKQGIIVRSSDGRCGLLLPDLEGIDSVEQQIFIACQKAGIDPGRDDLRFYHFTTENHN